MAITPAVAAIAAGGLGAAGAIAAGSMQSGASKDAAATSAAATDTATANTRAMYDQTRSDLQPFVQGGYQAQSSLGSLLSPQGPVNSTLGQISTLFGSAGPLASLLGLGPNGSAGMNSQLQNYPGYQFALQQGQQSLDRSAASRGLVLSGGQLKDSQAYGQGMASQLYGTYVNQLGQYGSQLGGLAAGYGTYGNEIAGVVNTGENAAAQTGNAGSAAASGISNALLTGAQQQGTAIQNAGTAGASAITGGVNNLGSILTNSSLLAPQYSGGSVADAVGPTPDGGFTYSDRRLKTDIRRVGTAKSGLPIYTYKFKGSPITHMGVMAQEVEQVAPSAVRYDRAGRKMVDYAKVSRLPPMKEAA